MENKDIKFVFFGTGDFGAKVLETLIENGYVPEVVVTAPDKPKGRKLILTPSPVKKSIMNYDLEIRDKIKILQPEKLNSDFIAKYNIQNTIYDIFIVADYGKILPKNILDIPQNETLNVHPSLLPKFRGPSPIQSWILSGEKETGVTIMLMDEEMDHGPILEQQELVSSKFKVQSSNEKPSQNNSKIDKPKLAEGEHHWRHKDLEKELAKLGGELLVKMIPKWLVGKIKPQEQNHSEATYTKKITKEDGMLDITTDKNGEVLSLKTNQTPSAEEAEIVVRKVRALAPWPGVYFFTERNGKKIRVIVTNAEITDRKLKIISVKPEGKNEMSWEDFLRGKNNAC